MASKSNPSLASGSDDIERLLQQSSLFAGLEDTGIYPHLATIIKIRNVQAGDLLIRQGDQGRALFLLLKGGVAVTSKDGECVYATFSSGSYFGELSMVKENIRRTASVIATERSVIGTLQCHDLKSGVFAERFGGDIDRRLNLAAEDRLRILHPAQRKFLQSSADKLDTIFDTDPTTDPDFSISPHAIMSTQHISHSIIQSLHQISTSTSPQHDLSPSSFMDPHSTFQHLESDSATLQPSPITDENANSSSVSPVNKFIASAAVAFNPARRRASVAVWSDPRLLSKVQSAQNAMAAPVLTTTNPPPRALHLDHMSKSSASSLMSLTIKSGSCTSSSSCATIDLPFSPNSLFTPDYQLGVYQDQSLIFNLISLFADSSNLASRVVNFLDIRSCFRLLATCKDLESWFYKHKGLWCKRVDLNGIKGIDDSVLSCIAKTCAHHVQHLNIKGCFAITDLGISSFFESSPSLKTLNLHGCWEISLTSFSSLQQPSCCPSMQCLDFSNLRKIDDGAIRKCMMVFPHLEKLVLGYCKSLSGGMFNYEVWTTPVSCNSHKSTPVLPSTPIDRPGDPINDRVPRQSPVAQSPSNVGSSWTTWRNLKHLNLQRCTGLRDDAFNTWPEISSVWNLETLLLGDCSLLSNNAISQVASTCPKLHTLGLTFCCALTEDAMDHIVQMKHLRVLDLSFCGSLVSHSSMAKLTQHCQMLERLGLRGCIRVDDRLVMALHESALYLRVVNLGQCRHVSMALKSSLVCQNWILLDTENVIEYPSSNVNRPLASVGKRKHSQSATDSALPLCINPVYNNVNTTSASPQLESPNVKLGSAAQ